MSCRCLGGVLGSLEGFSLKNNEKPMKIKSFKVFIDSGGCPGDATDGQGRGAAVLVKLTFS